MAKKQQTTEEKLAAEKASNEAEIARVTEERDQLQKDIKEISTSLQEKLAARNALNQRLYNLEAVKESLQRIGG